MIDANESFLNKKVKNENSNRDIVSVMMYPISYMQDKITEAVGSFWANTVFVLAKYVIFS